MNFIQFTGSLEIGLIYGLVAVGVFLSFKILDFPDLGVDGSFPLGAAVYAVLAVNGFNPVLATILAAILGACAGLLTAWLSTHLKFMNLLSGILVMTALYSINLKIMGRPNISLIDQSSLFDCFFFHKLQFFGTFSKILSLLIIVFFIVSFLNLFLKTQIGISLRATGSNARMARAQGIDDKKYILLGLAISNSLVAFAGALLCQLHGYADVTMGVGTIIIGLAAVIIGEAVLNSRKILYTVFACVIGAILYRFLIAFALNIGGSFLAASDLNLVTSVLVGLAMLFPDIRHKLRSKKV